MNGDDTDDLKQEVGGLRQDVRHLSVLVEQVVSQNQGVLEAVGDIQRKVADLPTRAEFDELKQDVRIIKTAVGEVSRDLAEHKSLPAHVAHGRA
jgi:archaellum component FlaC